MAILSANVLTVIASILAIATCTVSDAKGEQQDVLASRANERLLSSCLAPPTSPGGSPDAVAAALGDGADINIKDERSGQTCLMACTLRGKYKVVQYLLEQGADPTIPEKDGYTPPHGAGFQGRPEVMRILREVGNIDVINSSHPDGFAPFHRACWGREERHAALVQYLIDIGEDPNRKSTGDRKLTCLEMTNNPHTKAVLEKYETTRSPRKTDEM